MIPGLLTLNEIKEKGFIALEKELGTVGFIKFLNQFSHGSGDYTEERKNILKKYSVKDILDEIKLKSKKKKT